MTLLGASFFLSLQATNSCKTNADTSEENRREQNRILRSPVVMIYLAREKLVSSVSLLFLCASTLYLFGASLVRLLQSRLVH